MTKKEILTNAAAMFFAMCIPFVVAVLGCRGEAWHVVAENLNAAMATDLGIYIIVSMIGGCWIFNNMKTKEQRITFKMLPATDAEKFAVRVLYVTLVWWLMGIVAFCAADVFRMLVSLIVGTDVVRSTIPDFLSMLFGTDGNNRVVINDGRFGNVLPFIVTLYAWVFWVHSLYILGGAFFRRRQFVLTTMAHFVLMLVFTPLIIDFVDGFDRETAKLWADTWAWLASAVLFALGVLDWWLSYKIFRRMQVVNNKWVNL